jgi:hypothetical protein
MTTEKMKTPPNYKWQPTFVQEWTIEDMLAEDLADESDLLDSDECELLGSDDLIEEDSAPV